MNDTNSKRPTTKGANGNQKNRFEVKSLPIADVLTDLARESGGTVYKDANYFTLDLPARIGSGTISGIDFGYGFGMINYRCNFLVDTEISFHLDQVHPLKFMYAHEGSFEHQFAVESERHHIRTYQNLMVASERQNGHILHFRAGVPISVCSVEIARKDFSRRFTEYFADDEGVFRDLIFDVEAEHRFLYEGEYVISIADHVEVVLNFPGRGVTRSLCYEGRSYGILVDQWLQYVEDQTRLQDKMLLRRATVERVKALLAYVKDNLADDLNVSSLARRAELTNGELQRTVRHLTGMSVNSYVREQKLLTSMALLRSGRYNVSETLYRVGFSSQSYFSRKFKERWGVVPSLIGRQREEE